MQAVFWATPAQIQQLRGVSDISCCLLPRDADTVVNLAGMAVFLRLTGGRNMWYLVHHTGQGMLYGHALVGARWHWQPVPLRCVLTYF